MSGGSVDLIESIRETQKEFRLDSKSDIPIKRIQDTLNEFDNALARVLDAPKQMSTMTIFRTSDVLRSHVFVDLQKVREYRDSLTSDSIPDDLYYFLLDISDDFDIESSILFEPKSEIQIKDLSRHFESKFEISWYDDGFYDEWISDLREKDCHTIGFPITEMQNPLNYSFIVHEILHSSSDSLTEENPILTMFEDEYMPEIQNIPEEIREEVCLDLLTLHYIGPVYGLRIAQLPQRLGYQTSDHHPELYSRIKCGLDYIREIKEPIRTTGKIHPLFEEVRQEVEQELESELDNVDPINDAEYTDYSELHAGMVELFSEETIPTFLKEAPKLREYLGMGIQEDGGFMTNTSDDQVRKKLEEYMLDVKGKKKLALPMKPCLLLNLLVLFDQSRINELRDPAILSFKKWYVTKATVFS